MNTDQYRTIILEILRVGLISIRNLSEHTNQVPQREAKLILWANLCHSLPAVLLGDCDRRAVSYFLKGDAKLFCSEYPACRDADFCQIVALKAELDTLTPDVPPTTARE
jgi:hypothetical protein